MAKKIIPHIAALAIMFLSLFLLYSPYFTSGKVLNQGDTIRAYGMQAEMNKIEKETGEAPLWTQSMFAGMPTFQIKPPDRGNYTRYMLNAMMFEKSMTNVPFVLFMAMFFTYFFLIVIGLDWRISIIGAVCYALSTFYVDIAEAGHATKMMALALMPGMFAGALLTLRGKYLLGGALFALFVAMQIMVNHIQITYYSFLTVGILILIKCWTAFKHKQLKMTVVALGVMALAGIVGVAANTSRLWPTYEYSKETIRGKSELSAKSAKGDGLDKEYAFGWSYGVGESMTLLIPNYYGGGAAQTFRGTDTYQKVYNNILSDYTNKGMPREEAMKNAEQQVASLFYTGDQSFVGVAIYLGAVLCFLFVLGAFLVQGPYKIWLLISALFTLTLAWGGNFFLNHIFFDYFPMFNKFRAVSMALGLTQFFVSILAVWALQEMMNSSISKEKKIKALYWSVGIVGGIALLGLMLGSGMSFSGKNDTNFGPELTALLKQDRASLLRSDAFRSLFLILASFGLLWAFVKGKIKAVVAVMLVAVLAIGDIVLVNKRILFDEKFETPTALQHGPTPTDLDKQVMADKDPDFRVLDLRGGNPFTNANTSYFHKSLGGYHAAKLMIYQDVIEKYLSDPAKHLNVVGMLNGKYILQDNEQGGVAIPNPQALGNAWFVKNFKLVETADDAFNGLEGLNAKETALVRTNEKDKLAKFTSNTDTSASIALSSYNPDKMVYKYKSGTPQLAVFSEVYYPASKGWKVSMDGKPFDDFFKVDYLLRGLVVPAGEHTIEINFHPNSFYEGEIISKAFSGILILLFLLGIIWHFWKEGLPDVTHLQEFPLDEKPKRTVPGGKGKK